MRVSELDYQPPAPRQELLMHLKEPDALVATYSKGAFHRRIFLHLTESGTYFEVIVDFARSYRIKCEGTDNIEDLEEVV